MSKSSLRLLFFLVCLSTDLFSQANPPSTKPGKTVQLKDHATSKSKVAATANSIEFDEAPQASKSEESLSEKSAGLMETRRIYLDNDGVILKLEQNSLEQLAGNYESTSNSNYDLAFSLLKIHRNSADGAKYLAKALALRPTDAMLQLEAAWVAERLNKTAERNQAAIKARKSGLVSEVLINQAEWLLKACGKNGIIVTNGENDTYPFWTLANTTNATIISLQFINEPEYINRKLLEAGISQGQAVYSGPDELLNILKKSGKQVVLSWTIHPSYLSAWKKDLYAVGPGLILSQNNPGNINILRQFYFSNEVSSKLKSNSWTADPFAAAMANLLPGISILLDSESLKQEEKESLILLRKELLLNLKKAGVHGR